MKAGMRFARAGLLALLTAASAGACAHAKIPKTEIDDTPENRAIIEVISTYHRALEGRDAEAVLELVSPRYYEDNGNTDKADDYDYEGLRSALASDFKRTKRLQLDLQIESISYDQKEELAYAFIEYTYRAQSDFPAGLRWKTSTDRARLTMESRNGKWLIRAGL